MFAKVCTDEPLPASDPQKATGDGDAIDEDLAQRLRPCLPHEQGKRPQDVRVQLQYLKDDPLYEKQKPLQITPNFLDIKGRTNVRLAPGEAETIQDVRGREQSFSLDENGFKYVHAPTKFKGWSSQPLIAQQYLPELEKLLQREVDGCDEIIFYDARIRHADDAGLRVEGLSYNPFAKQVHTDNTERSVLMKIRNLTEMKADYLMSGRARIINIWRPIKHPVYDCGLAIADGAKLKDGDIIECDRRRQDTNEFWDTMGVIKYRPGFEWYYMSYQDESDILLFKNYDSATDVPATTCLHTAFDLPPNTIPDGAPTRESIEVRALIFTYPAFGRRPSRALSLPHPLAQSLKQGHLKRVDVEHSITDRVRTDIDEGNEVKDAVLMLRRNEIQRLETVQEQILAERDALAKELKLMQKQADIQLKQMDALQAQVQHLSKQLRGHEPDLRAQIHRLSAQLVDTRLHQPTGGKQFATASSDGIDERTILMQQLERANEEAQKWRAEALGMGNVAVSRAWQASVDETVRREREKDASVIDDLRAEIARLQTTTT